MYSPRRFKYIISDNKEAVQTCLEFDRQTNFALTWPLTTAFTTHCIIS